VTRFVDASVRSTVVSVVRSMVEHFRLFG